MYWISDTLGIGDNRMYWISDTKCDEITEFIEYQKLCERG